VCLGRRGILIPDIAKLATLGLINKDNQRNTRRYCTPLLRRIFEDAFAQHTMGGQYVSLQTAGRTSHESRLR
jgi:hypothetical protein